MADDFAEKKAVMMERWGKEQEDILRKLMWAPFTTGKFTYNEIISVLERDSQSFDNAKPTDYEVFVPFSNLKNKFKKELKEVDELMAEFGPEGREAARQAYMDRNQVPDDDLARMINPYYLYDPDDDEDEEE
jgi:hypothetical protein